VARRLAAELGVELAGVEGTGPGGRIVRADVRDAASAGTNDVELTPTQRTIAQRMTESRTQVPEFTLEAEIDMEALADLREELRALGREPLPSFNDLVVKAVAAALRQHRGLNASYASGKIRRIERVNVGIAVATDDALYVPTIFDADRLTVFEIAEQARVLIRKVTEGAIAPDELRDGTFTVSNLGMFGVRRFSAVINPPQAAILAVGALAQRAVVRDGALVARHTMGVTLACDHRILYGADAAQFLARIRALLEQPLALAF
jgi:pyruvate dehydrogenase E2 component (dihydrolipoamide acetyltransferase)